MKLKFVFIFAFFSVLKLMCATQETLNLGKSTFPVGVYYYPEHWNENQWERDLKRIAELGFHFTHFSEFAWSQLEPNDGKFDFSWLDRVVNIADKNGLKVIMCTPSAIPPAWLTLKHPEILVKTSEGFLIKHGMRLNTNGSHPVYQKYIQRILHEMTKRYGNNPAVAGWQIDNEPHFEGLYDYSDFAQKSFRNWLKNKYITVDALNQAWGASFWSFNYNNFQQIAIPNPKEHAANPHALLDFKRFTADAIADAIRFQSNYLRSQITEKQWVTTNFAYYKFLPSVDLFRSRNDLDFASHTMYLLSTFLSTDKSENAYRLGSGMELSFSTEMAKSIKGYTGIMELQPGQINWGQWNSQPLPGAVSMWMWHCFGLGDRFICTYRYRQPLFGGEQFHKGIMEPDGTTVSPGGRELVQTIADINAIKPDYTAAEPTEYKARRTAFLWKQDNLLSMETVKVTDSWDSWGHYYTYYQKLKTLGCSVQFIQETDSFDVAKFPFMVAPAYEMVDATLVKKWTNYVKSGGNLILSCRTGLKDNNSHLWESLIQSPIYNLIGARIDFFDQLPPGKTSIIRASDKNYTWQIWADILTANVGTESWATHQTQFYAGKSAVVFRKSGKGSVLYMGAASTDGALEEAMLRQFFESNKVSVMQLPDYVFVEWQAGFWVAVNYTSTPFDLSIPENSTILKGNKKLLPGGVTIWK